MKVKLLVLFNLIITIAVFSQNKSYFDLDPLSLKKTNAASAVQAGSFIEVKNDKVSMTMVPEGYFTLGTTSGLSNSKLDDNCQITFGHPYARTSFPVFSIDGTWYKPEEFFTSAGEQSLLSSGDTVKFTAIKKGQLSVSFYLYYQSSEQSIKLTCKVKNLDSSSHKLGLGLMLDPALGKNGDAVLALSGTYLKDSRIFQTSELLPELILWEKATGAKGLGVSLKFDEQPGKVIAGNWNEIYEKQSPDLYNSVTGKLYDLYFKIYWNETNIAAGSEKSETASIKIIQPEFSSDLFLRWDLPSYLTLDNNIVFPQSLSTYLEIAKAGTGTITSGNLKMELPAELSSGTLTYTYGSAVPVFQKLDLTAKTIYENKTVEAIAKVYNGTVLIDEIHRFINIPETPVSDTGLVVSIDTLMTSRYPQVSFIFDVLNKSKGTKIVNLTSDNVFLYENNTRITDLSFGKDTTGGMNAADIVFALDVTGSMGNEIDAVKKNIVEFADSLTKGGYDYQLGLVTFLDYIENVYPFTKDVQKFQQTIAAQYAHGGDDLPENSLQALMESSKFNFRPNSRRIVVWITDASYHENDAFTKLQKQTVIDSLLVKGIIVHAIGEQAYKSSYYDPVTIATGGNYYNITGNFRDILLDISRSKSSFKYLITYRSPAGQKGPNGIKLQIRYAGLGGEASVTYNSTGTAPAQKFFSFYPNPFNPEITFRVKKGNYNSGKIKIFDILGRLVKEYQLHGGNMESVIWNAKNEAGTTAGAGFYIAELTLSDENNNVHTETAKILYLK